MAKVRARGGVLGGGGYPGKEAALAAVKAPQNVPERGAPERIPHENSECGALEAGEAEGVATSCLASRCQDRVAVGWPSPGAHGTGWFPCQQGGGDRSHRMWLW